MKKTLLFFLSILLVLTFTACNLGTTEPGSGGGTETPNYDFGVFDVDTNIYSYYSNPDENQDNGNEDLQWYRQHDFNDQGQTVFSERYLANGTFYEAHLYEWDGDDLVMVVTLDSSDAITGYTEYIYDSYGEGDDSISNRITENNHYNGDNILLDSTQYTYDSANQPGAADLILELDADEEPVSGFEFDFESDGTLWTRNQFQKLNPRGEAASHLTLDKDAATVMPSVGKPLCMNPTDLDDTIAKFNLEEDGITVRASAPALPGTLGYNKTQLTASLRTMTRLWDSYWYYDSFTGSDSYTSVTFNAEPIPLPDPEDVNALIYGLLEDFTGEAAYDLIYGDTTPDNVSLPVRYYVDAEELDGPMQTDIVWAAGEYVPLRKTITYLGETVLDLVWDYDTEVHLGTFENLQVQGSAVPFNFVVGMDYHETGPDQGYPQRTSLYIGTLEERTAIQHFFYYYTDHEESINALTYLADLQRIEWQDGDLDPVATINIEKDMASSPGPTMTATIVADGVETGSYRFHYNTDTIRTGIECYGPDPEGEEEAPLLYSYDYGLSNIAESASGALNDANQVNNYGENELISQIKYDENGNPEIPYLDVAGSTIQGALNVHDASGTSAAIEFLLNEFQNFLP